MIRRNRELDQFHLPNKRIKANNPKTNQGKDLFQNPEVDLDLNIKKRRKGPGQEVVPYLPKLKLPKGFQVRQINQFTPQGIKLWCQ